VSLRLLLFDISKKTQTRKYYRFFKKTLLWNKEQHITYRNKRIQAQIQHFYKNSPFFKKKLDASGIDPFKIRSIDDLKVIPPLTREELMLHFDEILCQNKLKNAHYSTSSGTTGLPVKYAKDSDGFSAGVAVGYILWELAGWRFSHRQLHIWGNPSSVGKWNNPLSKIKSKIFNKKNIPSNLANTTEGLKEITQTIKHFKPQSIDGYTSSLLNLSDYILKNEIKIPKPKLVSSTAENLLPVQKDIIEKALGPVADLYGCGEINGIAIKPPGESRFFVFNPHIIVETEKVANGNLKEILVTDLDNQLLPFIRYKIGDLIDDVKTSNPGDPMYPLDYFTEIHGRQADLIYLPNGKVITPINLLAGTLFRNIGGIVKHKVIWEKNQLRFIFVTNEYYNAELAFSKITEYLKDYEVPFNINIVDDIKPGASGKYKYFEKL
jgi:phenylacetate-CoA ligase